MAHKGRFLTGIEETQADVMVGGRGGGDEHRLGVRKLASDGHHGGLALAIGIEDDAGRIAAESFGREGIDLEYAHWVSSAASFARIGSSSYTGSHLGVVFLRPEMRGAESSATPVNPLNLTRLMPA